MAPKVAVGEKGINIYAPAQATTAEIRDDSQEIAELEACKIEAQVLPDCTVNFFYREDPERGIFRQKVETRWNRIEQLGVGGFGEVWLEQKVEGPGALTARAVKLVNKARMKRYDVNFKREITALARFSKPQYFETELFVNFFGWFENDKEIFLAMEYLPMGDLAQCVDSTINESQTKQITIDMLKGLAHIHEEGFVHRDLKPQNIFVLQRPPTSSKWRVKIGDFGISKRTQNDDTHFQTFLGTQGYMAPEIYKVGGFIDANTVDTLKYDCAVDLWSLGCVIYKLLTGQIPFQLQNHSRELAWFCNGKCPFPVDPLAPRVSAEGILFIKNLLHPAPLERLTAKGGLQHSWILNDHESPRMKFPNAPGARLPFHPKPAAAFKPAEELSVTVVEFQTSDQQGVTNNSIWTATTTAVSTWETALEAQPGFCRERFEGLSLEEKKNMAQRLFNAAGYNPINGGIFTFEDALVTAAQIGDDVIVYLLLEAGVKPNHQCGITTGRTVLNSRMTPLVVAAQRGHELIVQMLLHYGANLNLKGTSTTAKRAYNSHTALHAAIESEHESVARLLIEAGASVEAKDYFGNLPIHSAAEAGQCATLELLLDRGANIQAKAGIMYDQGTPLHTAVRRKQKEAVRILIERQAPLEARSGSSRTALHEAVTWASEEIVEMLVAAGADLTARDRNKRTPFQLVQRSMIDSRTEINNIERLVNPSKKKTP